MPGYLTEDILYGLGALSPDEVLAGETTPAIANARMEDAEVFAPRSPTLARMGMLADEVSRGMGFDQEMPEGLTDAPKIAAILADAPGHYRDWVTNMAYNGLTPGVALEALLTVAPFGLRDIRRLMTGVTSTPQLVSPALYSAWGEEENDGR